jgi:superfamily II helicase
MKLFCLFKKIMKICKTCKRNKKIEDFHWKNKLKGYKQSICKECAIFFQKKYIKECWRMDNLKPLWIKDHKEIHK